VLQHISFAAKVKSTGHLSRYLITYLQFLIVHILIILGRMTLKMRGDNEVYPAAKRARMVDCEDTDESSGSLGNSTSSAHSNWF
jgi:hypothetical protein